MTLRPTAAAMQLFLEGQIALSEVEHNGCRVDRDYALAKREELRERIRDYEARMRADELYKDWRKRFGDKTNVGSPEQLAEVIFKVKGHRSPRATGKKGRASAAESALETVDEPFLKNLYLPCQKLRKALGTYLEGILREAVQHEDGHWYVHPHYNLNTVESFRSSCSEPNYQNNPSRNPEIGEIVRRCYVPRPGHQILEIDYSQIEVRTWCAYHKDRTMIDYVRDPSKDMHRDMAAQIFFLEPKQVSKELRSHVKNKFVFPSFYGSYYVQTAPSLWEALERFGLKVEGSGATVREHLAARGITHRGACDPDQEPRPGTFEARMWEIEEDFWGRRFAGVTAWKREWIEAYYRDGGCRFLTGFVMRGPHKRNDIINYSNQGTAFHCLLWSLIKIQNRLRRYKFRTRVIGEVHDSMNFDAHPAERDDVIDLSVRVMTEEIKKWAPWLNVPLAAEPEACPVDASWFDKAALVEKGGAWVPASPEKWEKKYGPWERQIVA